MRCRMDGCDEPRRPNDVQCEVHYREAMSRVHTSMSARTGRGALVMCLRSGCNKRRQSGSVLCARHLTADEADTGVVEPPRGPAAPAPDQETVDRIVAAVEDAGRISGPALADRLGTAADSRPFKAALKQAVTAGRIESRRGIGYAPPGTLPPSVDLGEFAERLVALIEESDGLTRAEMAQETGQLLSVVSAALKVAAEDGRVEPPGSGGSGRRLYLPVGTSDQAANGTAAPVPVNA